MLCININSSYQSSMVLTFSFDFPSFLSPPPSLGLRRSNRSFHSFPPFILSEHVAAVVHPFINTAYNLELGSVASPPPQPFFSASYIRLSSFIPPTASSTAHDWFLPSTNHSPYSQLQESIHFSPTRWWAKTSPRLIQLFLVSNN